MIETLGIAGLIALVAVLIYFKIPQNAVMAIGRFLSGLGK